MAWTQSSQMDADQNKDSQPEYKYAAVSEKVIRAFYAVYNTLGYGFLERVYINALLLEMKKLGLSVAKEVTIDVVYAGEVIGQYLADLVINDVVIVEVKAAKAIAAEHEAQLLNYLKATRFEVGLLLNFGPKAEIRRTAFDNTHKGPLTWVAKA
jgi:GxxExxY protein